MKPNPDIDELLNNFIDGELTESQLTDVKQMITHDSSVARRLQQLQQCKTLISSIPHVAAPSGLLEQVKASLERRTLLAVPSSVVGQGMKSLLMRKVIAAAAMIALVSVLGVVIYTIIAPDTGGRQVIHIADLQPAAPIGVTDSGIGASLDKGFIGRLELRTADLVAVDAFLNRAIEDNRLSDCVTSGHLGDRKLYSLSCSKEGLNLLLADLGSIWGRFDSTRLLVETEQFGSPIAVAAVKAEQISDVVNQDNLKTCAEVARGFAVLNNVAMLMPGQEVLAVIEKDAADLPAIPKPVLTWNQKKVEKTAVQTEGKARVNLTIVLIGTE